MTLWDECFGPLNLRGFLSFPSSIWWVSRWVFKPYRLLTHAVSAIFLGGWEFALKNFQEHKHCKYNVSGVSASCSLKSTKQVVSSSIVGGDNGWIELNWLDTARKQHRALLRDHTVLSPNYSCHVFHGLLYLYLPLKPCTIAHFSPTVHSSNSRSRKSNRLKNIYNVSYHIMTFTISFTQVSNKIPPFLAALPPPKKGVFGTNFIQF